MEKIVITYAGAIGCGKTTITNFISTKIGLPTFNNDAIRSEVATDFSRLDETEAQKRIKERLNDITQKGVSFIYDASVDRKRKNLLKEILIKNNYKYFIISIDLNKETLLKSYRATSNIEALRIIDKVYEDHQNFLKECSSDINLHINENNYKERLDIVYKAVSQRIKEIEKC